jgi:putative membrane protein
MKSTKQEFASIGAFAPMVATLAATPTAKATEGPGDPQIVGIVLTADQIDIDHGKIALSKSRDKAVRDFAQRMVTDHFAEQKSVIGLAEKLGVNGEDSTSSEGLKKGAAKIAGKLNWLNGKELDKFYIDNEVSYHKAVTDAVEAVLIPSARNSELKPALEGAQPLFLRHLERAGLVQSGESVMAHPLCGLSHLNRLRNAAAREDILKWLATL